MNQACRPALSGVDCGGLDVVRINFLDAFLVAKRKRVISLREKVRLLTMLRLLQRDEDGVKNIKVILGIVAFGNCQGSPIKEGGQLDGQRIDR